MSESKQPEQPDKNDKNKKNWANRLGLNEQVAALLAAAMQVEQRGNPPPPADLPAQEWKPGLKPSNPQEKKWESYCRC